jgi:intracellular multiplication protein IcmL
MSSENAENEVFKNNSLTVEQRVHAIIFSHRAAVKISLITSLTALILTILACALFFGSHTKNYYFATTTTGQLFRLSPLSTPIESDPAVEGFTVNMLTNTFTFDYVNYKSQIDKLSENYTSDAFTLLKKDLETKGGIVAEAVNNKWIVTATVMASPELIHKGLLPNTKIFGWKMRVPIMITYQNEEQTSSQRYYADVTVMRVDQKNNPHGVAIANLQLVMMS